MRVLAHPVLGPKAVMRCGDRQRVKNQQPSYMPLQDVLRHAPGANAGTQILYGQSRTNLDQQTLTPLPGRVRLPHVAQRAPVVGRALEARAKGELQDVFAGCHAQPL